MRLTNGKGEQVQLGSSVGKGGQGEVFRCQIGGQGFAAKLLKATGDAATALTERRVRAMVESPPPGWRDEASGRVLVAWPVEVLLDNGRFAGFIMPLLESGAMAEIHMISNPSSRIEKTAPPWTKTFGDWQRCIRTASNLARAVEVVHGADVVIGDFNNRNILVRDDATVTLLDCDSMQIRARSGEVFRCSVGTMDYTPPELLHKKLDEVVREKSGDLFALARHIHELLLEGESPFSGVWKAAGEKPSQQELSRLGLWVFRGDTRLQPRPAAPAIAILPPTVLELFRRALVSGADDPTQRPSATEWRASIEALESSLTRCASNQHHQYRQSLPACPWCNRHGTAAVAPSVPTQRPLLPPPLPPTVRPAAPPRSSASGKKWAAAAVAAVALVVGVPKVLNNSPRQAAGAKAPPLAQVTTAATVLGVTVRPAPTATAPATTALRANTAPAIAPPTTAPPPPTTPAPTTTLPPVARLNALIAADHAELEALVGSWIPQLSAKWDGVPYKGTVYGFKEILAEHEALRQKYKARIAGGNDFNFKLPPPHEWYITLVPQAFPGPDEVLGWCEQEGFAWDDCFAKQISHDDSGTTMKIRPKS